jgi:hypothetical protein
MEVVYKLAKNNEEIKQWVESHGGAPAMIDDPEVIKDKIGLRINWKGRKDEAMLSTERKVSGNISWDEFFSIMKREDLEFLYSDSEGINLTWAYKFVNKYTTEE